MVPFIGMTLATPKTLSSNGLIDDRLKKDWSAVPNKKPRSKHFLTVIKETDVVALWWPSSLANQTDHIFED